MKSYHFALVFIAIFVVVLITTDIKTDNLKEVIENKDEINRNLETALDDGVTNLAEVDNSNNISINKENAVNSFFMSLYSSFGIFSDKESQEKMNLYIPVVIVTMEDGYYVFYSDEYIGLDGKTYVSKRWSEKLPYYYEDSDFIYSFSLGNLVTVYDKNEIIQSETFERIFSMDYHDFRENEDFTNYKISKPNSILLKDEAFELVRKGSIIRSIEEAMAYYTSRHNNIAAQYGITYNFSLPGNNDKEWVPYIDDVGMYVVFQGYPYGNQMGETYNRVASSGAKISKDKMYYMEQKGWYLIYHKASCPELLKDGLILFDEPYYDPKACIDLGSYQCNICIPNSVSAPNISY